MSTVCIPEPILVGLIEDEPIRMAGLACIFERDLCEVSTQLFPVIGTVEGLLTRAALEFMVLDLSSASQGVEVLETVHRARPDIRLIVLGPEGDDELVMESIAAGARAYLGWTAGPELVRRAIEAVAAGSIWAPRHLLSKLIDRLLVVCDTSLTNADPHFTVRERQVLDLILTANSNREIARQLGIEERTVKAHVGRLMRKTGAENRIELSMRTLSPTAGTSAETVERRAAERRAMERRKS